MRDLEEISIQSQLDTQMNQEMKESGWRFDEITSMTIYFFKTKELNGSSYVKIPLRSSSTSNIENSDKYCFLWSLLAHLYTCQTSHPNRFSNYIPCFNEMNITDINFTNGFKTCDVVKNEKMSNLSIIIFELQFYQDGINWKHKVLSKEISKHNSESKSN